MKREKEKKKDKKSDKIGFEMPKMKIMAGKGGKMKGSGK